jgi:gliding motility-associated-like protein
MIKKNSGKMKLNFLRQFLCIVKILIVEEIKGQEKSQVQCYLHDKGFFVELVLTSGACRISSTPAGGSFIEFSSVNQPGNFMKRITISLFLFLFLFVSEQHLLAQKEANIWYFGRYLGIDFNSGTPVALNDGQTNTIEGVATISNPNGNLLFYTDGVTVWNRLHQVMPNGTGLMGDPSSSQSGVIVPKIDDTTRFYVFTVAQLGGANGLRYSVVNMTLDGGKGDIELKNIPVISNVTEKITAVRHCNNRDIWVIAHKTVSNTYYSFLVDPSGVNTTPVVSNTGSVLWGVIPPASVDSTTLGYLKASPDGKKIAAAHWTVNADVSDFNNATGVISNSYSLFQPGDPHYLVYGIEFSPNSNLLYNTVYYVDPVNAQKHNALFQYDISLATPAAVVASRQVISLNSDPIQTYAALQVASDGKMYMAKNTYKHIAAITDPNVYGPGCNYVSNAVQWNLAAQTSTFGLPTFIQSYFYPPDSFSYTVACPGTTGYFNYVPANAVLSVQWNFGDPASGVNNTATINNPVHVFSSPGSYNVMLIKFTNCGPDTIRRTIQTDVLTLNLGPDTLVCGGSSVVLNEAAAGSPNSFLWQDGSTSPSFTAAAAGLYWVQVTNSLGCVGRDTINVNFKPIPLFNLGADTTICQNDILQLNAGSANADSYLWNTNAVSSNIPASQSGTYWCEADKGGCKFRDSISIAVNPSPVVNLGRDTTVCEGVSLQLNATWLTSNYVWQDGSNNASYNVTQPGTYSVAVHYQGCRTLDTININHNPKPKFNLGPDQLICPGNSLTLSPVLDPTWQLTWQDGSVNPTFTLNQPGNFSLTATNACGTNRDDIVITKGICKVYVPTGFTPNNDGRNDLFRIVGVETIGQFDLKVFNRWGEIVFATTDKTKGWDGKLRGLALPTSTFVYILRYSDSISNESQLLKGNIVLIR